MASAKENRENEELLKSIQSITERTMQLNKENAAIVQQIGYKQKVRGHAEAERRPYQHNLNHFYCKNIFTICMMQGLVASINEGAIQDINKSTS